MEQLSCKQLPSNVAIKWDISGHVEMGNASSQHPLVRPGKAGNWRWLTDCLLFHSLHRPDAAFNIYGGEVNLWKSCFFSSPFRLEAPLDESFPLHFTSPRWNLLPAEVNASTRLGQTKMKLKDFQRRRDLVLCFETASGVEMENIFGENSSTCTE